MTLTISRYRPPDVLLGSTNYTVSLDMWGAGCILIEMLNGYPCFPGVRDTWDQLDKIFRVVGTPTEDTWPGVSRLPNYRPHKLCYYRPQPGLGVVWPRLYEIPFAEHVASVMLQPRASRRVSAEQALRHRYFSDLPASIHSLGPGESVYSLPGVTFSQEHDRLLRNISDFMEKYSNYFHCSMRWNKIYRR